jgi:patatin-like phospholipase/acyl hydrolase
MESNVKNIMEVLQIHENNAREHLNNGNTKEAKDILTKLIKDNPNNSYHHYLLGKAHEIDGGDLSRICYHFVKAKKLQHSYPYFQKCSKYYKKTAIKDICQKQNISILAIDGGGAKGIIPSIILEKIEEELRKTNENARIQDLFDVFSGTSVGGIASVVLTATDEITGEFLYDAKTISKLMIDHIGDIFNKHSHFYNIFKEKYTRTGLENVLKNYLKDSNLDNPSKALFVTSFNETKGKVHLFSNLTEDPLKLAVQLKDIAEATSAAPSYFPPKEINGEKYLDGGLTENNPSMATIAHLTNLCGLEVLSKIKILSLSTGITPKTYDIRLSVSNITQIPEFIELVMTANQTSDTKKITQFLKGNYIRINPKIAHDHEQMDDKSEANIHYLEEIAANTMKLTNNSNSSLDESIVKWTSVKVAALRDPPSLKLPH